MKAVITTDYKGNPSIKMTQDSAEVKLTIYTQDYNQLLRWFKDEIVLDVEPEKEEE